MNENIDLTKILKDCPKGTKLYTTVYGEVTFEQINNKRPDYPINVNTDVGYIILTKEGYYINRIDVECILFPSKDQRDWSKFTAPWYKKDKFDPKTLQPFDKILVRDSDEYQWKCAFYSHQREKSDLCKYATTGASYEYCIPYNDETKHLVGTTDKAPEFYRYWEN